jgi:hypothetical protein
MKATLYKLRQPYGKEGWVLCSKEYIEPNSLYINNGVFFTSDSVYGERNNPNNSNPRVTDHNYKVLTQSPDFSLLSEEDAKRIGWFDVDKIVIPISLKYAITKNGQPDKTIVAFGIDVSQKALELTADRKFTEKDMEKALMSLPKYLNEGVEKHNWIIDKIKSLSQPKSWEVEYKEENGVYKVLSVS